MKHMKNNFRRIVSCIVVMALLSGLLTACDGNGGESSGADNRMTTATGETQNTVNPSASEPNQSIASDALITETTTESTTETRDGYVYTINGIEYTISHPIEDYVYTLPGSEYNYIHLDEFLGEYGMYNSSDREKGSSAHIYRNADGLEIDFNSSEFSLYYMDKGICNNVYIDNPGNGISVADIWLNASYPVDVEGGVYVVNGVIKDNKLYGFYSISREMLVCIAYTLDTYNSTGSTADAVEPLAQSCRAVGRPEVSFYIE